MEELERYQIQMLCFPVTIDGVGYVEKQDLTPEQFYVMLESCKEVPVTAHVTAVQIMEEYKKNFKLEHDPRITKVGAFLRKTSLAETVCKSPLRPVHMFQKTEGLPACLLLFLIIVCHGTAYSSSVSADAAALSASLAAFSSSGSRWYWILTCFSISSQISG